MSCSLQAIRIALDEVLPNAVNVVLPIDFAGVVNKRETEFATGRLGAKQALTELDVHDFVVLKGEKGEPLWPAGIVGSISHTQGICMASVAHAHVLLGLGIDIEAQRELRPNIQRVICREEELCLNWHSDAEWAKLILFSAKESVYKALYPTQQRLITFKEVLVEFDAELSFVATLVDEGLACRGACRLVDGFVVSAACL